MILRFFSQSDFLQSHILRKVDKKKLNQTYPEKSGERVFLNKYSCKFRTTTTLDALYVVLNKASFYHVSKSLHRVGTIVLKKHFWHRHILQSLNQRKYGQLVLINT